MSEYMDYLARRIGYATYVAYLQSEHWRIFSSGMRSPRCFCCTNDGPKLQVHHITYDRLGEELPTDVETLCGPCHVAVHELVKSGIKLNQAHYCLRQRFRRRTRKKKEKTRWVGFTKLLNKSKRQTMEELIAFMEAKKLLCEEGHSMPTEMAWRKGYVKNVDGLERWNERKYIRMLKAHNKVEKLKEAKKFVPPFLIKLSTP